MLSLVHAFLLLLVLVNGSDDLNVESIMEQQLGRPVYLRDPARPNISDSEESDTYRRYLTESRPIIVLQGRSTFSSREQPTGNVHIVGPVIGRDRHFVLWQPECESETAVTSMVFSGASKWWRLCLVEGSGLVSQQPRVGECNNEGSQVLVSFKLDQSNRYAKYLFHDSRHMNDATDSSTRFGFISLTIIASRWYTLPRHAVFVDDTSVSTALRETTLMSGRHFVVKGLWRWRLGGVRVLESVKVHKKEGSMLTVVLEVSLGVDLYNHVWAAIEEVAAGHITVGEGRVLNAPSIGQLKGYEGNPFVYARDQLPLTAELESVGLSVKVWVDDTVVGCLRVSLGWGDGVLSEGESGARKTRRDDLAVDLQENEYGMI